jgi:hypothetical protein
MDKLKDYLFILKQNIEAEQIGSLYGYSTWLKLRFEGVGSNFTLPDISGLQAQTELRSPFLDLNFINTSIRVPYKYRIGSYRNDRNNKFILKKIYSKYVGEEIAFGPKYGMAWNMRFDKWIIEEKEVNKVFREVIEKIGEFNVDPKRFVDSFDHYCSGQKNAGSSGDTALIGFMLSSWLIKEFNGQEALEKMMYPLRNFHPAKSY